MSLAPRERIVLASASATRTKLLAASGIPAETDPPQLDEAAIKSALIAEGADAGACAAALAAAKAVMVSARHRGALAIGADQMLECNGSWFDKPRDIAAARAQLMALRGRVHRLVSAAAVALDGVAIWQDVAEARLLMRPLSEEFIDAYLAAAGEEILGSVGAYRLEGLGAQLFSRVEGDLFTVLGLPLLPLLDFLRARGALKT